MNFIKRTLFIFTILMSAIVFAAEAPTTFQTDGLRVGKGSGLLDKYLEFNTGDGALNPKMSVDTSLNRFTLNQDSTRFGDGTLIGNKDIEAYIGSDPLPKLRYNVSTSKWQVSHDGVVFADLGESGATFTQQSGAPTTIAQNASVVVTHPTITNNQVIFSVIEAQQGLSNTQLNYNTGTASNFVQQDSVNGTQFNASNISLKAAATGIDAFTTMLMHFDSVFDDVIVPSRVFTNNGASITTPAKFGANGALLSSGPTTNVTTPNTADFAFGTGDFTVDFWVNFANLSLSGLNRGVVGNTDGALGTWYVMLNASTTQLDFILPTVGTIKSTSTSFTTSQYYHIEFTRSGGQMYAFVDGVAQGSPVANTTNLSTTSGTFYIGYNPSAPRDLPAYMDELRVSKGIGRHIANFTPETQAYGAPNYPTSQSYYVRTNTGSQIDATAMSQITNCVQTSSVPVNTTLKGLVSFDGRSTWQKWNGSSWAFEINNSSLNTYDFKVNGNSMAEICTGLTNLSTIGISTIDVVAGLGTTNVMTTPTLTSFVLTYTGAFDNASLGKPGSSADYGIRRLTPTTTKFTKQSTGPSTVYINVIN